MFKILVTGGSGFIGKNLVEKLLLKNYLVYKAFYDIENRLIDRVEKLNNKEIEPQTNFENIEKIDFLINCSAKLPEEKNSTIDEYRKINVERTLLTAKQALKKGLKRFVHISTASPNDYIHYQFIDEANLKKKFSTSRDFYRISKLECENALWEFSRKTGLEVVILRPPLVYGKFVKNNFLTLLNLINKKIPLPLKNIKNLRSYCAVENLVDLITVCIHHPKALGNSFFVSDNQDISISDLILKLSNYMQITPKLFSFPSNILNLISRLVKNEGINNLLTDFHVDISNTRKILNWSPVVNLDQGLEKTVQWYLKNR